MTRVWLGLLAAVLIVVAAARLAYSLTAETGAEPVHAPWSRDQMRFVAWNGEEWTAWIRGGAFELKPQNTGKWSRHANRSIAFVDRHGEPWQARVEGDVFLLARHGDWDGAVERSDAIRYRDWSGRNQLRTVPELER